MASSNRTIPFMLNTDKSQSVWCLEVYDNYIFAGTGPGGVILRSETRDFWQTYYTVSDVHVSSLYAYNGFLYAGTSAQGMIYVFDLSDDSVASTNTLGEGVVGFAALEGSVYSMSGRNVYLYDVVGTKWDFAYEADAIISCVHVENDKFYLGMEGENVISFDGSNWSLETDGVDNVSSFRKSTKDPFSHVTHDTIVRSSVLRTDTLDDESVFDVFPKDYVKGISSITKDRERLILGASNQGRVFRLDSEDFGMLFQTEGDAVHSLLNIADHITLAAIGNKMYLLRCFDPATEIDLSAATTTTTTTSEASTSSNFSLISPNGGETFELGTTTIIQWTSQRGVNEGVKIELYKGEELAQTINAKTSNDGEYEWFISSDLEAGIDYQIKISWVTTGEVSSADEDSSDSSFALTFLVVTTTTTTTQDSASELFQNCQGIPILVLLNDDYVTCVKEDDKSGHILFGTFLGKILSCSQISVNGYLASGRSLYGEAVDGFGHISETTSTEVLYGLYKKIAEISEEKAVVRWSFTENAVPLNNERITGIFTSPVLYVREDLGLWKDFSWSEDKPTGTAITICLRSADTIDVLDESDWDYCFDSTGKTIPFVESIDPLLINGKYLQFKIMMTTDVNSVTPTVLSTGVSYSTKQSLYFFSTKFALETDSDARRALLTANVTEPTNTEITFGVANDNSSDWNDYQVVDLNRFFSMDNYESLKVGIKFSSYDLSVPKVAEFSVVYGADEDTSLNQ